MKDTVDDMGTKMERRRSQRFPYNSSIKCYLGEIKVAGFVKNVSSNGLLIEVEEGLPVGENVCCDFTFRSKAYKMKIIGKVVRKLKNAIGLEII